MDETARVTLRVPARERLRVWHDIASQNATELHIAAGPDFRAAAHRMNIGDLRVVRFRLSAHEAVRTPALAAGEGPRPFSVRLQLAGTSRLEQGGREATVGPGDVVLSDAASPFATSNTDDVHFVTLLIPDGVRVPGDRDGLRELTATRLPAGQPGVDLIGSLLRSVARSYGKMPPGSRGHVERALLNAVEALLSEHRSGTSADGSDVMRVRAQHHIERNLRDPDLDPAAVAGALGISVRSLHLYFENSGTTVAASIRESRLDRARTDLMNPAFADLTVSAVAHRWGFTDRSHFSRAFSSRFGVSPAALRAGSPPAAGEVTIAVRR
ncbi:helix-turn-helix domain-containing protein [Streptomyces sp. NPDC092369]|uniref:AraC-like ligand-binding domain-containing protein n=1 Tax=Streptomyces sp. NPDC092369 TaxID=3366015 RepID=UPI0038090B0D